MFLLDSKAKLRDFENGLLVKAEAKIDVSNPSSSFLDLGVVVTETKQPTPVNSPVDLRHTSYTFTFPDGLAQVEASPLPCSTSALLASS